MCVGTNSFVSRHQRSGDRGVFLAYFVFTRHGRKGDAKEACQAVVTHLFRGYDAVEIRAEIDYRHVLRAALSSRSASRAARTTGRRRWAAGRRSTTATGSSDRRADREGALSERRAYHDAIGPVALGDPPARLHLGAKRPVG